MSFRHILKVIHKNRVNNGAASRTNCRHCLGGSFFRDLYTEALGDFNNKANQNGRCFLGSGSGRHVLDRFFYGLRQSRPNSVIATFGSIVRGAFSSKSEDFKAGEFNLGLRNGFSFAARNVRDRPEHNGGGYGQLHR